MKTFVFALIALTSLNSFADQSCPNKIENYFRAQGQQSQPPQLKEQDANGDVHYTIRTNYYGGDAAYQVVVDSQCNILEVRNIWSE